MKLTKNIYRLTEPLELECGETLESVEIVFHTSVPVEEIPQAIAQNKRVVWICHALTANSDPSDWWPEMVGDDRYFDPHKEVMICANIIGSCYGTTGPASWGSRPLDFPVISVRDTVNAHILLRKYLGINKIDIMVGASVGGYQSLEWAIMEPDLIANLVVVASNARITPWATAFNEAQRMALRADHTFEEQLSADGGRAGLKSARAMALISYRSYEGYNLSQSESDDDIFLARRATTYQEYQGEKLANRFDAYTYYYLSLMLDSHNVGRSRGGVAKALSLIKSHTLLVGIDSDILFPSRELEELSKMIEGAHYTEISSAFGHDGFLIEREPLERVIDEFLS